jgi:hypothetical protein
MKRKLKGRGLKTLKFVHLFFVALWVGGNISAVLLSLLSSGVNTDTLLGVYLAMEFIDYRTIIPGSAGCLIVGIIYGIWTGWGFFKFRWISVKWGVMIVQMVIGAAFLGQAVAANVEALQITGPAAVFDESFIMNQRVIQILGLVQTAFLIFLIGISIYKPWKSAGPRKHKEIGTQRV